MNNKMAKNKMLGVDDYVRGVKGNNRALLAKTITLLESVAPSHLEIARKVLSKLLPFTGQSLRVGVTGIPGSGKSTLIDVLGSDLIKKGYKVAVLAVDPSSATSKGSILGDKTRMTSLAAEDNCFIRPSPTGGTLGGVTRKSRETMLVCEAAGYDIIFIETVGVGQSEIAVRAMVDFFLLMLIGGAGDELQGIKRGVIEIADAVLINKADGLNKSLAEQARDEYSIALKYLPSYTPGWRVPVNTCSAMTGDGISELWQLIQRYQAFITDSGTFGERRRQQALDWVFSMVENHLLENFYRNKSVNQRLKKVKEEVMASTLLPTDAATTLLNIYYSSLNREE